MNSGGPMSLHEIIANRLLANPLLDAFQKVLLTCMSSHLCFKRSSLALMVFINSFLSLSLSVFLSLYVFKGDREGGFQQVEVPRQSSPIHTALSLEGKSVTLLHSL